MRLCRTTGTLEILGCIGGSSSKGAGGGLLETSGGIQVRSACEDTSFVDALRTCLPGRLTPKKLARSVVLQDWPFGAEELTLDPLEQDLLRANASFNAEFSKRLRLGLRQLGADFSDAMT
jgi:hypothetical protein